MDEINREGLIHYEGAIESLIFNTHLMQYTPEHHEFGRILGEFVGGGKHGQMWIRIEYLYHS